MGAITGTLVKRTEFAGDYKILVLTAPVASSSDTVTLTAATHGISEIVGATAHITAGLDNAFSYLQTSYSGLVITVASFKATGAAADDFTGTTIELWVIGK